MGRKTIFLAGAAGAIGIPLSKLLVADGWHVVGSTRRSEKAEALRAIGVEPVLVDVFDADALKAAVVAAAPEIVIHQLTDLPAVLDPARMAEISARNAHLREVGTANLLAATLATGARRIIAQSIAFAYAPGTAAPIDESAPLAGVEAGQPKKGVASLEAQILEAPIDSVVLRYGRLYGPNTWTTTPPQLSPLHVDAAADAARRAVGTGRGIYNIAENDGSLNIARATAELGWTPDFRLA